MSQKCFYNYKSRDELKDVLAVTRGDKQPELLLKNGMVLDVVCGEFYKGNVAIIGGYIAGIDESYADAKKIIDCSGKHIVPGFINSHLHIESSLMTPFEFEKTTLPMGTTTAICDPHEIVNVLGEKGLNWFLKCAELMQQNLYVQISSCVPALAGMETNGAKFDLEQMKEFIGKKNTLGMAEMMNFPGVINGADDTLEKMETFQKAGMGVDGHAPMMQGRMLDGYIAAGVRNCHETVLLEEAKQKLRKGMAVMIREGSVAKNLHTLAPIINEMNSINTLLCTDDRNPYDLFDEGELTYMLKVLIKEFSITPEVAYRMASFSAANHFQLNHLGMIAPGKQADIVILDDVKEVKISETIIKGVPVSEIDLHEHSSNGLKQSNPPVENSIVREKLSATDFQLDLQERSYNVIGVIPNEIITKFLKITYSDKGFEDTDVLKMAVVERYGHQSPVSIGLVKGFGLTSGAIASSVAHDSHNIIVVGHSDEEMAVAVNSLIASGGGFCVAKEKNILSQLDLPIAGLMSLEGADKIYQGIVELKDAFKLIGCTLDEPFLQLSFLALPVIPELKLTDQGLFDVSKFSYIKL